MSRGGNYKEGMRAELEVPISWNTSATVNTEDGRSRLQPSRAPFLRAWLREASSECNMCYRHWEQGVWLRKGLALAAWGEGEVFMAPPGRGNQRPLRSIVGFFQHPLHCLLWIQLKNKALGMGWHSDFLKKKLFFFWPFLKHLEMH